MTTTAHRGGRLLDVPALDAVETRMVEREAERSRLHAEQLRDVLEHRRLHQTAGMSVATEASLALLLGCSEWHARMLLEQADTLAALPGGLAAVRHGLLSVEGSRAVVDLLARLDLGPRLRAWELLHARLQRDAAEQRVLPPARLRDVLRRLIVKVDAEGAEARRRQVVRDSGLELRRRDDGLVDLMLLGVGAADGQAVLDRLDQTAPPGGPDDRTVPARRRDTALDLLLGRGSSPDAVTAPQGCQVSVLIPLSAALAGAGGADGADGADGTASSDGTDGMTARAWSGGLAPAELSGHGPLLPSEASAVLASSPVLRPVWTDEDGVPVAVGQRTVRPGAGPSSVRQALLDLSAAPPPTALHPRHPDDHPPRSSDAAGHPGPARDPRRSGQHPPDSPGPYRPPADLLRLLDLRSPRCEWPGCGTRASRCDHDHDLPHPEGPTCACNLGPLCRRHHQVKQTGWTKTRTPDGGVRWTSPTGRTRTSPPQHRVDPAGLPAVGLSAVGLPTVGLPAVGLPRDDGVLDDPYDRVDVHDAPDARDLHDLHHPDDLHHLDDLDELDDLLDEIHQRHSRRPT